MGSNQDSPDPERAVEYPEFQQLATIYASSCHPMLAFARSDARLCRTLLTQMSEFVILSSELFDRQTAEEVDEPSPMLLKEFGRTLLALLGWGEDEHIDVTAPVCGSHIRKQEIWI